MTLFPRWPPSAGALLPLTLAVALAGCDRPCETATCLAEEAVAAWPSDAAGVTARVRAIPDEMTRTVVVARLAEAFPGATRELCSALPPGTSRERCERINNRPHLSVVPGAAAVGAGSRAGDVPLEAVPDPTADVKPKASTFPDARLPVPPPAGPIGEPCKGVPDPAACLDGAAVGAALAGDAGGAAEICAGHADERWADECRFSAAETAVRSKHAEAYPAAAVLCGAAERFTEECWAHVLTRLPRNIPPPGASARRAKAAIEIAETVREAWAPAGDAVAAAHVDRFWALYFANVYREARDPDGSPLDLYPEAAHPHVRAALAMRLTALGRLGGALPERVASLREALARRGPPEGGRGRGPDLVFVPELGSPVSEGPTTYFLGAPRRAVGSDETQELALCVIESAARVEPPDRALLEAAAGGADARVAAEARRLLAALPPAR